MKTCRLLPSKPFYLCIDRLYLPHLVLSDLPKLMRPLLCLFLFACSITVCFSQNKPTLKLWYNKPSGQIWENALPIGNGRLGAMVYGNIVKENIQLNEHTVWSGSTNRNDNPDALAANDTSLIVTDANAATIYVAIATNFNNYKDLNGDENARVAAYLKKAYPKSFVAILNPHVVAYQKYFHRVKLDLGATMDNQIVFDVFSTAIRAAETLKKNADFVAMQKQKRIVLRRRRNACGYQICPG